MCIIKTSALNMPTVHSQDSMTDCELPCLIKKLKKNCPVLFEIIGTFSWSLCTQTRNIIFV